MKSGRRQSSKNSGRKQSARLSQKHHVKQVFCSIPIKSNLTAVSKSTVLSSHKSRNSKPQIIKNQQPLVSVHSRKLSIQQPFTARQNSIMLNKQKSRSKQKKGASKNGHARSNSALSQKQAKMLKQTSFKIDLTKLSSTKYNLAEKKSQINTAKKIKQKQLSKINFQFQFVIGKGGFGKVWNVWMKKNHHKYAMKEMDKVKIISKRSIHSVLNQRSLLAQLRHPFLVNMSYAFQDRQKLYLVMDLMTGGDLRYHMGSRQYFSESQAKFFISCIILGLQYMHQNSIIHRDIKPENLVFDQKGYLRITDLGIARLKKENNSNDTSGTPGYMAPQVMCRQDHSFQADIYALGIIAYELMMGYRPYNGRNRKQIRDNILSKQVQISKQQIPVGWSIQSANFINKLIQRKPNNRLGSEKGIKQLKQDDWYKYFPWENLSKKCLKAPFIPQNVMGSEDYRAQISQTSQDENFNENLLLLRKNEVQEAFEEYEYFERENKKKPISKINKKMTKNSANTANTHGSYVQEKQSKKQSVRNKKNNYLRI